MSSRSIRIEPGVNGGLIRRSIEYPVGHRVVPRPHLHRSHVTHRQQPVQREDPLGHQVESGCVLAVAGREAVELGLGADVTLVAAAT